MVHLIILIRNLITEWTRSWLQNYRPCYIFSLKRQALHCANWTRSRNQVPTYYPIRRPPPLRPPAHIRIIDLGVNIQIWNHSTLFHEITVEWGNFNNGTCRSLGTVPKAGLCKVQILSSKKHRTVSSGVICRLLLGHRFPRGVGEVQE